MIKELREGVAFVSEKHDEISKEYLENMRINAQQKNKLLNKRAAELQKKERG